MINILINYLNKNIIENFEYQENDFIKKKNSNKYICIHKYIYYFIHLCISLYAGYLAYKCNSHNPLVLFNRSLPDWLLGLWGFILGWIYLIWYLISHYILKYNSCNL